MVRDEGVDPSRSPNLGVSKAYKAPPHSRCYRVCYLVPHEGNEPLLRTLYEGVVPSWVCGEMAGDVRFERTSSGLEPDSFPVELNPP